jgi:hypothetical protein
VRQPLVHVLPHVVGRLDVQLQDRHDAERAEGDDRPVEDVRVVGARQPYDAAVSGDQLDGGDRGGQGAVLHPGPVRAGGAGAADRDVRQRAEVRQGEAGGVQRPDELP